MVHPACAHRMGVWACATCHHVAGTAGNHKCATIPRPQRAPRVGAPPALPLPGHYFAPANINIPVAQAWDRACAQVVGIDWALIFNPSIHTSSSLPPDQEFRQSWYRLVDHALTAVTCTLQVPNDAAVKLFFLLPKLIFGRMADGRLPKKVNIRHRLRQLLNGNLAETDSLIAFLNPSLFTSPPVHAASSISKAKKAESLVELGETSRAWRVLESDLVMSDINPALIAKLKDLHPPSQSVNDPPRPLDPPAPPPFTEADVAWALSNSRRGAAPGPDGWRADYLFGALVLMPKLNSSLFAALTCINAGALPAAAMEFAYGGVLNPLRKPDNGIRPITIGSLFVRLTGKAIAHHHEKAFLQHFLPEGQLGVAVSSGADAAIHAVRAALSAHPDWGSLQLDFKNAFNLVSRSLIEAELKAHFPQLLPYFLAHYGARSRLLIANSPDGEFIWSSRGVQQGDPLGPFFFALALQAGMKAARLAGELQVNQEGAAAAEAEEEQAILCLILAYLDDVILCGPLSSIARALSRLMQHLSLLGSDLVLNMAKCVLWSPSISPSSRRELMASLVDHNILDFEAIQCPPCDEGFILLGSPIGSQVFASAHLEANAHSLVSKLERVNGISSISSRLHLLRYCAVPRINNALRTSPPSVSSNAAILHDINIIEAFVKFQGFGSDHQDWRSLIQLPLKMGQPGLISAVKIAPLAYVASLADAFRNLQAAPFAPIRETVTQWLSCGRQTAQSEVPCWDQWHEPDHILVEFSRSIEMFRQTRNNHAFAEGLVDKPSLLPTSASQLLASERRLQQRLTHLQHEMTRSVLMDSVSPAVRCRLLSHQQLGGGAIYGVVPSCRELVVSNEVYTSFARSSQCIQFFNPRHPSEPEPSCLCGVQAGGEAREVNGSHADACPIGGGTTERHDGFLTCLVRLLRMAGYTVYVQWHAEGNVAEDQPDILVLNFPQIGQSAFIEGSVTCNDLPSRVRRSAHIPLAAAAARETEKLLKYKDFAAAQGRYLFTAVMETTGAFGVGLKNILSHLSINISPAVFEETAHLRTWTCNSFKQYATQSLSVAFWQGVTQMAKSRALGLAARSAFQPSMVPRHVPRHYNDPLLGRHSSFSMPPLACFAVVAAAPSAH